MDERVPPVPPPFGWRREGGVLWLEARLARGRVAFSTRAGGSSTGPYESLNLGVLTGDDAALVASNRATLARALGRDPDGVVMGWQVHGATLQRHDRPPARDRRAYAQPGAPLARADAQLTGCAGLTPLVLVADCFPLALVTPSAVAMVHCGWRGVAAGIVARALEAVRAGDGSEGPEAVIGPGIGPCCYEVGDELREAFRAAGHETALIEGTRFDLALAIAHDLKRGGVGPERVAACSLCTSCNAELFFSHRRDGGVTGRQAGLAWLGS